MRGIFRQNTECADKVAWWRKIVHGTSVFVIKYLFSSSQRKLKVVKGSYRSGGKNFLDSTSLSSLTTAISANFFYFQTANY